MGEGKTGRERRARTQRLQRLCPTPWEGFWVIIRRDLKALIQTEGRRAYSYNANTKCLR